MVKLLSFADLHYCKEREKKCFEILDFIAEQARIEKPNFITFSGDLFHKPIMNSNSHGLPALKAKLDGLSQIAPIIMIYGTPSHDVYGSLEIFQSNKIVIVRPGEPYSIYGREKSSDVFIYAIPEPSKQMIIAGQDNTDQAGRDLNLAMYNLCLSYAAHRKVNPDWSAIVLGHGIVKNTQTSGEKFVEKASAYLTENDLAVIDADVYLWGDIHRPYKFETIHGGYCGSFSWDWNECGYKPQILKVEISKQCNGTLIKPIEIPFIPERIKITKKTDIIKNKLAWLESKTDIGITVNDLLNQGALPGSKVTVKPEIKKVIRSTEIMNIKSYPEMFKLWKPDATKEELNLCRLIQEHDQRIGAIPVPRTISLISTKIRGAKPFLEGVGANEIFIDWTKYLNELIGLIGPGGMGKSALLDYITPFTEMITQPNSLISTFESPNSMIENKYRVNDDIITLKIMIRPDKKTPTAEYYAYINDIPVPECNKNLSPYQQFVYKTFGTPRMFAVTVFRTQFDNPANWQGSKLNPSLINVDNATLKELVHEFSGTDKKSAFLFSKQKADDLNKAKYQLENILIGYREAVDNFDIEKIKTDIDEKTNIKIKIENERRIHEDVLKNIKKRLSLLTEKEKISDKAKNIVDQLEQQIYKLQMSTTTHELNIFAAKKDIDDLPGLKKKLSELQKQLQFEKEKIDSNRLIDTDYRAEVQKYNNNKAEYDKEKKLFDDKCKKMTDNISALESDIKKIKSDIENNRNKIKILDDPCPECGFVRDSEEILGLTKKIQDSKSLIEKLTAERKNITQSLSELRFNLQAPEYPSRPEYFDIDDTIQEKVDKLKEKLNSLDKKQTEIDFNQKQILNINTQISELKQQVEKENKNIIPGIGEQVKIGNIEIENVMQKVNDLVGLSVSAEQEIKSLIEKQQEIKKANEQIEKIKNKLTETKNQHSLWLIMMQAWGRDGIPAMILENIAPEIDKEANDLLQEYYPGLQIETSTLRPSSDGKKMIEDFKINIVNTQTGRKKPINCLSGEQRDFTLIAICAAFRKMNEMNTGAKWNLSLLDEPDSSVSEELMGDFWNMVEEINSGTERLNISISHSPEAKNRFEKTIDILDFK